MIRLALIYFLLITSSSSLSDPKRKVMTHVRAIYNPMVLGFDPRLGVGLHGAFFSFSSTGAIKSIEGGYLLPLIDKDARLKSGLYFGLGLTDTSLVNQKIIEGNPGTEGFRSKYAILTLNYYLLFLGVSHVINDIDRPLKVEFTNGTSEIGKSETYLTAGIGIFLQ